MEARTPPPYTPPLRPRFDIGGPSNVSPREGAQGLNQNSPLEQGNPHSNPPQNSHIMPYFVDEFQQAQEGDVDEEMVLGFRILV